MGYIEKYIYQLLQSNHTNLDSSLLFCHGYLFLSVCYLFGFLVFTGSACHHFLMGFNCYAVPFLETNVFPCMFLLSIFP